MAAPLVFITGASSGIGQALALRYHRAGYRLALVARRTSEVKTWAGAQGISADSYEIYSADVAVIDSIVAAGRDCIARQGVPDVVIANAGISVGMDTAVREDLDVMARTFATNNIGVAATFHPFVQAMAQRGSGRIVLIGSVAGHTGGTFPGVGPHYGVTKGGIHTLVRYLAARYTAAGLLINGVAPGTIDTPMLKDIDLATALAKQPMKRAAKPEEVALPIAFLCSDAASFISGAVLDINGGNYLRP